MQKLVKVVTCINAAYSSRRNTGSSTFWKLMSLARGWGKEEWHHLGHHVLMIFFSLLTPFCGTSRITAKKVAPREKSFEKLLQLIKVRCWQAEVIPLQTLAEEKLKQSPERKCKAWLAQDMQTLPSRSQRWTKSRMGVTEIFLLLQVTAKDALYS